MAYLSENTKILMFDGSTKNIQDIKEGDFIMGDDNNKRLIINKFQNYDFLYEISSKNSSKNNIIKDSKFIVNKFHKLLLFNKLKDPLNNSKTLSIEEYLQSSNKFKKKYFLSKNKKEIKFNNYIFKYDAFQFGKLIISDCIYYSIPDDYKLSCIDNRYDLLKGIYSFNPRHIYKNNTTMIYIEHFCFNLCKDIQWIARSLGLTCKIRKNLNNNNYRCILYGANLFKFFVDNEKINNYPKESDKSYFHNLYKFNIKRLGFINYYTLEVENNKNFLLDDFDVIKG
jgi:hypothetical protein